MLTYAIRHAQSRFNTGHDPGLDSDLTDLGRRQVEALARRFSGAPVAAVYSSPFKRCLQTAIPVARALGLAVRIRPELCEFHNLPTGAPPPIELPDIAALVSAHPGVMPDPDFAEPVRWPRLDESRSDMIARMRLFAGHLKTRWIGMDDTVLVFSHGSPIARLVDAWVSEAPGPSFRFIIDNATVNALRFAGGIASLICLNEASHLQGLEPPAQANLDTRGLIKPQAPSSYW